MSNENPRRRTPEAIEKGRRNLELKADITTYIENGGHWHDLIPELSLEEFGPDGVLNDTPGGYGGLDDRAKRLTSLAMEGKTTNKNGETVTPELVQAAIKKLSGSKVDGSL